MLFNSKFILASSSRSRYMILKNNKLAFKKILPLCDESSLKKKLIKEKKTARKISLELSRIKAKDVSKKNKNQLVVGSDTIVAFKNTFLTKAKNMANARKIITLISGKKLKVYSSASVFYNEKEVWNTTQKTAVKIRVLLSEEVDEYLLKTGEKILTSVGCFQAEAQGPNIIENIRGDFFNVLGFPLFPFLIYLRQQE